MNEALYGIVLERLTADPSVNDEVISLVLAACEGERGLEAFFSGETTQGMDPPDDAPVAITARAWVKSISVSGFRGIGPPATLEPEPGPGLTLVVGRNGSGKSSFAEGLEMLLTGDNRRWSGKTSKIWQEGWRNLHHADEIRLEAELLLEGNGGPTRLQRSWSATADLDDNEAWAQHHGQPRTPLEELGWDHPLANYRPFLSYNELGAMLDAKPSEFHDALSRILGLDDLVDAKKRLADARLARQRQLREATAALLPILQGLENLDDPRAPHCLQALSGASWDVDRVAEIIEGSGDDESQAEIQLLRELSSLKTPSAEEVQDCLDLLRATGARLEEARGETAREDLEVAELLQRALDYHARHDGEPCPVCLEGTLDDSWRKEARTRAEQLTARAGALKAAREERERALRRVRELTGTTPPGLEKAADVDIDADAVRQAFGEWAGLASIDDLQPLAEKMEEAFLRVGHETEALRRRARSELDRRQAAWQPIVRQLAAWLPQARTATQEGGPIDQLKAAEDWLKATDHEIRQQRFSPIAVQAQGHWKELRQQSNVDLSAVSLAGAGPRRRVSMDVTVDGKQSVALGVMSQGELHSLALSLFLPRAMLSESPFGFMLIDDPVQSMDPARVDGLARVLESCAKKRQVIVFTHDARLPESVRRLQIDATVLEVSRGLNSTVTVRASQDPVTRCLDDAWAISRSENLPARVGRRVVGGLCRRALEAASVESFRRRRLGRGDSWTDVQKHIDDASGLTQLAALALFDDPARGGDVLARVYRFGSWAGDAYKLANKGSHEALKIDLTALVKDTQELARRLRTV